MEHGSCIVIGGLLVALPKEQAKGFCQELEVSPRVLVASLLYYVTSMPQQERDASPAWIIGDVTTGMYVTCCHLHDIVTFYQSVRSSEMNIMSLWVAHTLMPHFNSGHLRR